MYPTVPPQQPTQYLQASALPVPQPAPPVPQPAVGFPTVQLAPQYQYAAYPTGTTAAVGIPQQAPIYQPTTAGGPPQFQFQQPQAALPILGVGPTVGTSANTPPVGTQQRVCYNCGQPGHVRRDCPNSASAAGVTRTCYRCGQPGHISRSCPFDSSSTQPPTAVTRTCYKCGAPGHLSRECPENAAAEKVQE